MCFWCRLLGFVLGLEAFQGSMVHGTCRGRATRIPRSTMDHWTLGTSIQMLSSYCMLFLAFSLQEIQDRNVYDAVSDRVLQVVLAVVNDQAFN